MLSRDNLPRQSGILLAVSSLPSPYGIGSFGIEAYKFIDFLKKTNQSYWQMLPLVPLGEGNSPYKSPSSFAGEILYIDLDFLVRDGLLDKKDLSDSFPDGFTDYEKVKKYKIPLIKKAAQNFDTDNSDYKEFLSDNEYWINDYACFAAAQKVFDCETLTELPDGIKYRLPNELNEFKAQYGDVIEFYKISQYFFYAQYFPLKRYAEKSGIKIIGDIPFYVSPDSADVWAHPDNFVLERDFSPKLISGVPPDMFSKTGQRWGNPLYDFSYLAETKYDFLLKRFAHCLNIFDVVRIDHFRAFADYYCIDANAPDATSGKWLKGPGMDFFETAKEKLKNLNFIAEDLGGETDEVKKLVNDTGFPNMKVLQFAFNGTKDNPHLPQNCGENCVLYTGTHDNNTMLGYYKSAPVYERAFADSVLREYSFLPVPYNFIKYAYDSKARLVIVPMQDILGLDESARMNVPGVAKGNWTWRLKSNSITEEIINRLINLKR